MNHYGRLDSFPPYVGGDDDEIDEWQAICECGWKGKKTKIVGVAQIELITHLNEGVKELRRNMTDRGHDWEVTLAGREHGYIVDADAADEISDAKLIGHYQDAVDAAAPEPKPDPTFEELSATIARYDDWDDKLTIALGNFNRVRIERDKAVSLLAVREAAIEDLTKQRAASDLRLAVREAGLRDVISCATRPIDSMRSKQKQLRERGEEILSIAKEALAAIPDGPENNNAGITIYEERFATDRPDGPPDPRYGNIKPHKNHYWTVWCRGVPDDSKKMSTATMLEGGIAKCDDCDEIILEDERHFHG